MSIFEKKTSMIAEQLEADLLEDVNAGDSDIAIK